MMFCAVYIYMIHHEDNNILSTLAKLRSRRFVILSEAKNLSLCS